MNRREQLRIASRTSRRRFHLAMYFIALLLCPATARAQFVQGIDVSRWQGDINWTSVKNAGITFAFTKATEGVDFVDIKYHQNMQGARNAGVLIGPYHFCRVDSKNGVPFTSYDGSPFVPGTAPYDDAVSEANDFLEAILPYYRTGQHLPPVADVERLPNFPTVALERTFISNWVQLFSDTVRDSLGVRPIIYRSRSGANTYYTPSVAAEHELWLAWWRGTGTTQPPAQGDTPLWDPWLFWQWTDSWSAGGINPVDGDVFGGTMDELTSLLVGNDGANGDFNRDGMVDAADYVVWRRSRGQTVPLFSGADGNGNSRIDDADYAIWRSSFGTTSGGGAEAVPEPGSLVLVLAGVFLATLLPAVCRKRRL